jgi:hypothetical protein
MTHATVPDLVRAFGPEMPLTTQDCSELAERLLAQFDIRPKRCAHGGDDKLCVINERAHGDHT